MSAVVGRPTVENCLSGFNSSIFAYGQTGSGKTHTMIGELPAADGPASLPADVSSWLAGVVCVACVWFGGMCMFSACFVKCLPPVCRRPHGERAVL